MHLAVMRSAGKALGVAGWLALVTLPFDFPHRFAHLEQPATGFVDEVRWFTVNAVGSSDDPIPAGAAIFVRGWMLAVDGRGAATSVVIRIDDTRNYQAHLGTARSDVAEAFGNADFGRSGFEAVVPTGLLDTGPHVMSICTVDTRSMQYAQLGQAVHFRVLPNERRLPEAVPFSESSCDARIDDVTDISFERPIAMTDGGLEVARGTRIALRGWAFDTTARRPASGVFALIDGHTAFEGRYGSDRPDVARHTDCAALGPVGYTVEIPTIELQRGVHRLEIVAMNAIGDRLLHSGCILDLIVRERAGRPHAVAETAPAFLDSVTLVERGRNGETRAPLRARRGDDLFVRGWAIDGVAGTVAAGVLVIVDDGIEITALYGLPRPDIAQAHENEKLQRCGFTAEIKTDVLAAGRHSARCYVVPRDGRGTLATLQQFEFEVVEGLPDAYVND